MKFVYLRKEDCCGCSACYSVCAKQAITMKPDEEGFLYPVIDQTHCVDCGKCTKICPVTHKGNYKENLAGAKPWRRRLPSCTYAPESMQTKFILSDIVQKKRYAPLLRSAP